MRGHFVTPVMPRKSKRFSLFLMVPLIETSGFHRVMMLDVIQCGIHSWLSALNLFENVGYLDLTLVVAVNTCYATNGVLLLLLEILITLHTACFMCALLSCKARESINNFKFVIVMCASPSSNRGGWDALLLFSLMDLSDCIYPSQSVYARVCDSIKSVLSNVWLYHKIKDGKYCRS